MADKQEEYRKALEKILIFVDGDNDGDNIPAIKNIATQALMED